MLKIPKSPHRTGAGEWVPLGLLYPYYYIHLLEIIIRQS